MELDTAKPCGISLTSRLIIQLIHSTHKHCMVTVCLIIGGFHVVSLWTARQRERKLPCSCVQMPPSVLFVAMHIDITSGKDQG